MRRPCFFLFFVLFLFLCLMFLRSLCKDKMTYNCDNHRRNENQTYLFMEIHNSTFWRRRCEISRQSRQRIHRIKQAAE